MSGAAAGNSYPVRFNPTRKTRVDQPTERLNGVPSVESFASGRALSAGRYVLRRPLGSGGMSVIWLAHDRHLDRLVVIKALSDSIAGDDDYLARFDREARTAAKLNHPNLVPVYDFDAGERPFLVMEYVPGGDLAGRIETGSPPEPAGLAQGLLGALEHIHAAGVIHRDIKPQNILIGIDGRARLTDFGIAQPRGATRLTRTGLVLGTGTYIAPEVLAGEPSDERSDIYSLGVTLAAAAEGHEIEPDLEDLIERMRAQDPNDRPRSARRALAELERLPASAGPEQISASPAKPASAPASDPLTAETSVVPELATSTTGRWVPAALVAALAVVVAFIAATEGGRDPVRGGEGGGKQAKAAKAKETKANAKKQGDDASSSSPTPAVADETSDSATGRELNDEGYDLIQAGKPEEAVPVLVEAVEALASSGEIEYAYALFNLGWALRLAGRPEEAIPVLEQRLEIPNQRSVVRRELQQAWAEVKDS